MLSTEQGKLFMMWAKEELMKERWFPEERPNLGYYREGFNSCLRYMINIHNEYKRGEE